jgi:hypothetical protein
LWIPQARARVAGPPKARSATLWLIFI